MVVRSGQLDEISQSIGRLSGQFESIEKYMHAREHGINNLSQKVDGLRASIGKDIAAVEARIGVQISAMETRLAALELTDAKDIGARNVITWFLQSPLVAWLFALAVVAWTALRGHGK